MNDNRITELLALAELEGLTLPYPPEVITALEDDGHIVDLVTGHIITDGASMRVTLTAAGEAELFVAELESGVQP